jgi:phosphatidylinositol 3-kinase
MPLRPSLRVSGVHPRGCNIFKSALYPTVVTLAVHPGSRIDWAEPDLGVGLRVAEPAAAAAVAMKAAWAAGGAPAAAALLAATSPAPRERERERAGPPPRVRSAIGFAARVRGRAPGGGGGGSGGASGAGDDLAADGVADGTSPVTPPPGLAGGSGGGLVPVVLLPGGGSGGGAGGAEEEAAAAVAAAVSAAMPPGAPPATYKVIFKTGDDMRQDQLVIQMIRLMDAQLKRVGLDLKLTPYRVLAMSPSTGCMEMVLNSKPVSAVMAQYRSDVMAFFRAHYPQEGAEYGIDPEVMDTYVKSAAGYAVMTYLLGIGDRHMDNMLLDLVSVDLDLGGGGP